MHTVPGPVDRVMALQEDVEAPVACSCERGAGCLVCVGDIMSEVEEFIDFLVS